MSIASAIIIIFIIKQLHISSALVASTSA